MRRLLISLLALCLFLTSCRPNGKGTENGHDWVDLGLSVKWATCNIGAHSPSDYGDYFAWGETATKDSYIWSSLKYCLDANETILSFLFSKYNTDLEFGLVDNLTQLVLSDDAARVCWGGHWRMPTKAEFDELLNNCSFEWTSQLEILGFKVTSLINGNSIFLSTTGMRDGAFLYDSQRFGAYWSSSLGEYYPYYASYLTINAPETTTSSEFDAYLTDGDRYYGLTIRPVIE